LAFIVYAKDLSLEIEHGNTFIGNLALT
jgi:hypothetical protein